MTSTDIGIEQNDRDAVSDILAKILADEHVLYIKTRNYHWNVAGSDFYEYHGMFEEQYNEIAQSIDEVAERIRSLGGRVHATLKTFSDSSRLSEQSGGHPSAREMISDLLADHESIVRTLRQDIKTCSEHNDVGTEDFLTGLMEKHEKTAWMLRASLG